MVALSWTLTKPPILGGVVPKSLKGKVIEPTSSISEPVGRATIGMVTVRGTPCRASAPSAEMRKASRFPASVVRPRRALGLLSEDAVDDGLAVGELSASFCGDEPAKTTK